jgi:MtN3 and saliva related transmembrane protein
MNRIVVEAIGYAAAFLATGAFLPQVAKTVRERSAKDISLGMYVLFCAGVSLWLVYGVLISSWPVIVSNVASLIFSAIILVLKIKHG